MRHATPAIPLESEAGILENLTIDDFSSRVGENFRVIVADQQEFIAQLAEVTALGSRAPSARVPFSLMLRNPSVQVPQGIYRVEHDQLGALDIFLVPLGPDHQGMRYEAIFT